MAATVQSSKSKSYLAIDSCKRKYRAQDTVVDGTVHCIIR